MKQPARRRLEGVEQVAQHRKVELNRLFGRRRVARPRAIQHVRDFTKTGELRAACSRVGKIDLDQRASQLRGGRAPGQTDYVPVILRGEITDQAAADDAGRAGDQCAVTRHFSAPRALGMCALALRRAGPSS